jgi:nucleoside-diphosphate-sugar epimerase
MVLRMRIVKGYQIEEIPQVNLPINTPEKLLHLGFGDLGMQLVPLLDSSAYSITGVCRRAYAQNYSHLRIRNHDLFQRETFTELLQQAFDVIVISMTPAVRSDEGYQQAYVQTCDYLIQQLQQVNWRPRLILFVSSTSVYAQSSGEWVDENSLTEPTEFNGKRLLEAEARLRQSGFPVCVVRFSGIYGPGRDRLINQVKTGKLSASNAYTNRIHIEDCARVLAHLIQLQKVKSLESVYLASDSCPATLNQVHLWLAEKMAIKNSTIAGESVPGGKRISNSRLLSSGFEFLYEGFEEGYSKLINDY